MTVTFWDTRFVQKEYMMLSRLDKSIISLVSKDIPLTKEPFRYLAASLGIEERVLLARIKAFKGSGLMRKFTAVINHRKIGFRYNAMVIWDCPQDFIDKAGKIMSSFDEVSHCYQREVVPGWKYNLYSMVHGRTKRSCFDVVRKIHEKLGRPIGHKALFSSKEEKKVAAKL